MNSRPRFATFSLPLLLIGCFLSSPFWATDERTAAGPLAEPLTARNSTGLPRAERPAQAAGTQSPATETGPLFPVVEHRKWGYIDKTGKIVIPLQYYHVYKFSEGLAFVTVQSPPGELVALIDETGKVNTAYAYSFFQPFSEGLALVEEGPAIMGYIDKTGKMVISPQAHAAVNAADKFREGLANVRDGGKWGYIDKTGKMVISPQFSDAYGFAEGLANVNVGGKWGYIDKTGKMIISPQFPEAYGFTEGLAAVKVDKKLGFIDQTGKMVIPPQYDTADHFSEGLAGVRIDNKIGYIDHAGKYVWVPTK